MDNNNIEDMDLEGMTTDELESVLAKAEDAQTGDESVENQDQVDETEETTETTETTETEDQEADGETETEDQDELEQTLDGEDIPQHYRGKSVRDFYEMQINANSKISSQENAIYNLKKDLELARGQLQEYQGNLSKKEEDDILSKYDQEDMAAIRKILRSEIQEMEQEKTARIEQKRQSAVTENELAWKSLEKIDPNLFKEIEKEAQGIVAKDPENTYYKSGWFLGYVEKKRAEKALKVNEDKTTLKKRAVTAKSSGSQRKNTISNKSEGEMSADEYLAYAKQRGLR